MDIEQLREFCLSMPLAAEDIKWEHNLCFMILDKIFCIASIDSDPLTVSLKATPDEFQELTETDGIIPAPYLARGKWVTVQYPERLSRAEWERLIRQSYELIKAKIPKSKWKGGSF